MFFEFRNEHIVQIDIAGKGYISAYKFEVIAVLSYFGSISCTLSVWDFISGPTVVPCNFLDQDPLASLNWTGLYSYVIPAKRHPRVSVTTLLIKLKCVYANAAAICSNQQNIIYYKSPTELTYH